MTKPETKPKENAFENKPKTRKIDCRVGDTKWMTVPTDWRKAIGIRASRHETNMGLAERDYSIKCKTGAEPLMVVEGFWIWWCYTHNKPMSFCETAKLEAELADAKKERCGECYCRMVKQADAQYDENEQLKKENAKLGVQRVRAIEEREYAFAKSKQTSKQNAELRKAKKPALFCGKCRIELETCEEQVVRWGNNHPIVLIPLECGTCGSITYLLQGKSDALKENHKTSGFCKGYTDARKIR